MGKKSTKSSSKSCNLPATHIPGFQIPISTYSIFHCYSSVPNATTHPLRPGWGEGAFTTARRFSFPISTKYWEAKEALLPAPTSPAWGEIRVAQNFPTWKHWGLGNTFLKAGLWFLQYRIFKLLGSKPARSYACSYWHVWHFKLWNTNLFWNCPNH